MSQAPQGFVPEKVQEYNRRASQDMSEASSAQKPLRSSQEGTPKKEPTQNSTEKQPQHIGTEKSLKTDEKPKQESYSSLRQSHPQENKNPFSPHLYRNSRPAHGHFEMGPRGLDYSPHRMGIEFSNRLRDYGPQRSTSIHGHELTDAPIKPEYLGHRSHFGSQIGPGGITGHPDVVFRHDYYSQMGFSPPRASRFSSQEYLNAPGQYGRWPDYRAEYRQRRRSQQDLHSMDPGSESVTALREHWDEANARVLQRKAQLDAMLGDSQRYEARRRDADAWLARMEARLANMAPPGHTADVLEMQLREQKSFHAEVHQYKHQIELFGQLTQRLIAVYRNDDTTRIKRATEAINHRYNELNNSIIARGKALNSAVSSLQNFDRSLEKFVAWLSEAESLLDAADRDPHLLKVYEHLVHWFASIFIMAVTMGSVSGRVSSIISLLIPSTPNALVFIDIIYLDTSDSTTGRN
ncbi:hypothetical protein evm_011872 [Chilo suppressalis]|nr:hypothetical protein evm_011872 [Chilo suppressalis]